MSKSRHFAIVFFYDGVWSFLLAGPERIELPPLVSKTSMISISPRADKYLYDLTVIFDCCCYITCCGLVLQCIRLAYSNDVVNVLIGALVQNRTVD